MRYTFQEDDVLSTMLIEEETREPFFATVPFHNFWSIQSSIDTLAIYGIIEEIKGKYTAAALKFKRGQITDMSFLLDQMDLNIFMDSFINPGQCVHPFIGTESTRYSWIVDAETMVCFEGKTKRLVARTRWTPCPDKKVRLQLEIGNDDLGSMDGLVVTCIICEIYRRQNKKNFRKGSFLDL